MSHSSLSVELGQWRAEQKYSTCCWLWKALADGAVTFAYKHPWSSFLEPGFCLHFCGISAKESWQEKFTYNYGQNDCLKWLSEMLISPTGVVYSMERATGGSEIIMWYLCSWPVCWKRDRCISLSWSQMENFSLMQKQINSILTLMK